MNEASNRRGQYRPIGINASAIALAFLGVIAGGYLFTRDGCDNEFAGFLRVRYVKVDTWDEWREHLKGTDLYRKYGALNVSYEPDSIRADFVRHYNAIVLRESDHGRQPDSLSVTQAWAGKVGLWNEGTTLHLARNSIGTSFAEWESSVERNLKHGWTQLSDEEFFINATISAMFKELILHGPNDHRAVIALPFFYEK